MHLALPTVAAVRVAMWLAPGALIRAASRVTPKSGDRARAAAVGEAVRSASRYVPHASCLVQATSAQLLLALMGSPGQIMIGVARTERSLAAHAWLVHDGRVIVGDGAPECYEVLGALHVRPPREPS